MIEVSMGKENQVDGWQLMELKRRGDEPFGADRQSGELNSNSREKNRIGKNLYSKKINQHRCVADPRRGELGIIPFAWLGSDRSRGDGTPARQRPFTRKMSEPAPNAAVASPWFFGRRGRLRVDTAFHPSGQALCEEIKDVCDALVRMRATNSSLRSKMSGLVWAGRRARSAPERRSD